MQVQWSSSTADDAATDEFIATYGVPVGLGVVFLLMLGALFGVYRAMKGRERTLEIAKLARERGYTFHPDSLAGVNVQLPFETFKRGDARGTSNVLRAEIDRCEVHAFDFWWYVEQENRAYRTNAGLGITVGDVAAIEQPPRRQYYSVSCAMVGIDNVLPHLIVARETRASRAASSMGVKDLQLESEEFNRTFHVRCNDRDFATKFLDAQMQDFMISAGRKLGFEARGRWLLIHGPILDATDMIELLPLAARFRRSVPRLIDDLFPPLIPGADA
jgi:hypothetical protein